MLAVSKTKAVLTTLGVLFTLTCQPSLAAPITVLKELGGVDTERGSFANAIFGEIRSDASTNTVGFFSLAEISSISDASTVSENGSTDADLGSTGVSGSFESSAGNDAASASLSVTSFNVPAGDWPRQIGAGAVEFQTLRFNAPTDREILVSTDYVLRNSILGDPLPTGVGTNTLSIFGVYDMSTFVQSSESDLILGGVADDLIFQFVTSSAVGDSMEIARTDVITAQTNVDYLIWLAASVSVSIDPLVESPADLQLSAFVDPIFRVDDPDVAIVRTLTVPPVSVPEPSTGALLLVGLLATFLRCGKFKRQR